MATTIPWAKPSEDQRVALAVIRLYWQKDLRSDLPVDLFRWNKKQILEWACSQPKLVSGRQNGQETRLDRSIQTLLAPALRVWLPLPPVTVPVLDESYIVHHIPLREIMSIDWTLTQAFECRQRRLSFGPRHHGNTCAIDTIMELASVLDMGLLHYDQMTPRTWQDLDPGIRDLYRFVRQDWSDNEVGKKDSARESVGKSLAQTYNRFAAPSQPLVQFDKDRMELAHLLEVFCLSCPQTSFATVRGNTCNTCGNVTQPMPIERLWKLTQNPDVPFESSAPLFASFVMSALDYVAQPREPCGRHECKGQRGLVDLVVGELPPRLFLETTKIFDSKACSLDDEIGIQYWTIFHDRAFPVQAFYRIKLVSMTNDDHFWLHYKEKGKWWSYDGQEEEGKHTDILPNEIWEDINNYWNQGSTGCQYWVLEDVSLFPVDGTQLPSRRT